MSLRSAERIVLASASPTRAQMLRAAGLDLLCDPAGIDEDEVKHSFRQEGLDAASCARALAAAKAMRVSARHVDRLVIGADQMLDCGGLWLDKARDRAEARQQLLALRGRRHELPTAIAVVRNGAVIWQHLERPSLTMRDFGEPFLDAYLATLGPEELGAVGVYRLEGRGAQLFARIEGDYFAILGLPLLSLLDFLRGHGALPS